MKINIVTLFPKLIETYLDNRLIKRAIESNILEVNVYDLRDYTEDKHKKVDDTPYGGGAGMVIKAEPFENLFKKVKGFKIYASPQGVKLNNHLAKELSDKSEITIVCGHYEGIDERVIEEYIDLEVSIGDFVLTGGELPSLIILDSIVRFVPGFIKKESIEQDSFENNRLDYGSYTKPREVLNREVPDVLLSGNHSLIDQYRERESLFRTLLKRGDLLTKEDKKRLKAILKDILN